MKTALTELLEDLNSMKNSEVLGIAKDAIHECIINATSYLEIEKQQIIEAHEDYLRSYTLPLNGEQYYNSTFNNQ